MPHPKERTSTCRACLQRACTLRPPPPPRPTAHAPRPRTGRSPNAMHTACRAPIDRAAGWGGSREKKRYNRSVPRRVLAQCLPPTEGVCSLPETGTQGTKGAEEGHTAKPPAPQRGTERNRSGRGGQKEKPPPPLQTSAAHRACILLATCLLRRKENKPPPPPTPPPPQEREEDGEGTEYVPPADKAARWGGSTERARYHKAVPRLVLAPCLPPTEGTPRAGTQGTKGPLGGAAGAHPHSALHLNHSAGGPVDGATGARPHYATSWVTAREALRMAPQVPVPPVPFPVSVSRHG